VDDYEDEIGSVRVRLDLRRRRRKKNTSRDRSAAQSCG